MSETTNLLQMAVQEIKGLRHLNQIQSARLDMFDSMMLLFTSRPKENNQGMSPDLVWQIEKHIENKKANAEPNQ